MNLLHLSKKRMRKQKLSRAEIEKKYFASSAIVYFFSINIVVEMLNIKSLI